MINRRHLLRAVPAGGAALMLGNYQRTVAQENSTFVIGSLEEPGSLSALVQLPHHFPADVPQTLLFDSLTQFMPDSSIAPKLATEWTVDDDELTYTFTLNPNAKFHDGNPVTADDVVFTFEACKDPATNSSDEGLETVESVEAIDDHIVRVRLSKVTPSFLAQGGSRGIVPRHILAGNDIATDEFNRSPVGSGPYRLARYLSGESITFEPVADHYRGAPVISSVEFRIITDQNVLLTQLMSGELNYGLAAPRDLPILEQVDSLAIMEVPTPRFYNVIPNHGRTYWQDIEVRRAILGGIDRAGIVSGILFDHGDVINANVAPASWAHTDEGVEQHPFDPDLSRATLDSSGWLLPDGGDVRAKDGVELSFKITLYSYDQILQQAMLVAQQNLADIGVALEIETVEPGVFAAKRDSDDFDALARIWNPVYDPDQSSLLSTGNFYDFSNPEIDALCADGIATSDREARLPVYHELQQRLSQELPMLPLYTENELHIVDSRLSGIAAHPVNIFWDFEKWTFQ